MGVSGLVPNKREKRIRLAIGTLISIAVLVADLILNKHDLPTLLLLLTLIGLFGVDQAIAQLYGKDAEEVASETIVPSIEAAAKAAQIQAEDIKSLLRSIEHSVKVTEPTAGEELKQFRDLFHHYHLTKDKSGKCVWIYKVLNFSRDPVGGQLITYAPIMPETESDREHHMFQFDATVRGHRLIVVSHRPNENVDVGVEVFFNIDHFTEDHPPLCGARLITTFHRADPVMTISLLSFRKLLEGKEGPIGDSDGSALEALWNKHSNIARLPPPPESDVPCDYFNDSETAIAYLANQYATSTTLTSIFDTHVRTGEHNKYSAGAYQALRESLNTFFARRKDARFFGVFGQKIDLEYVEFVKSLADENKSQRFASHRLKAGGPLMNFVVLEHEDESRNEVLFGWRRGVEETQEPVFRSRHPKLVKEFRYFHDLLRRPDISTRESFQTLMASGSEAKAERNEAPLMALNAIETLGSNTTILPKWNQGRFNTFLENARSVNQQEEIPNEYDLQIVTTFFINWTDTRSQLKELLRRGARIRILFMNPDNKELICARFGVRRDGYTPEKAVPECRDQITWLKALPGQTEDCKGELEVDVSDIMPSGFVALGRKKVVFGLMPAEESFVEGPMIEAPSGTPLWKTFDLDVKARWKAVEERKKIDAQADRATAPAHETGLNT